MKRFFIFLIVGPIAGHTTQLIMGLIMGGTLKSIDVVVLGFLVLLPFALVFGLVPALIAAIADLVLERRGVMSVKRWLVMGVIGYLATYILMLQIFFEQSGIHSFDYRLGLIGGVAGVVCSWLSDRSRKSEMA